MEHWLDLFLLGGNKLKIYFEVEKVVIFTVRKYWLPEFIV